MYGYWLLNDVSSTVYCLYQLEPVTEVLVKLLKISVKYPIPSHVMLSVLLKKDSEVLCLCTDKHSSDRHRRHRHIGQTAFRQAQNQITQQRTEDSRNIKSRIQIWTILG